MQYYRIFFFLFFFIASCTKETKTINLFNKFEFELTQNENEVDVSTKENLIYQSLAYSAFPQIPLYKVIKSNEYTFYLGLPYNTSLAQLYNAAIKSDSLHTRLEGDSVKCFRLQYSFQQRPITNLIYKLDNNLISIIAFPVKAVDSDSLFSSNVLLRRFVNK